MFPSLFKMNNYKNNNLKGFTLIEIVISLAIFSIVALVAVGSLVRIISANRQSQAIHTVTNSVTNVLDSMSRELRVGTNYRCLNTTSGYTPASNANELTAQACLNINTANNTIIYFKSSKTATYSVGSEQKTCNLIYGYRFAPNSTPTGTFFKITKIEQTGCGASISAAPSLWSSLIDTNIITGYNLKVYSDPNDAYPYSTIFIRLTGYAGVNQQDRTEFDVQTQISQRTIDK